MKASVCRKAFGNRSFDSGKLSAGGVVEHDPTARQNMRSEIGDVSHYCFVFVTTVDPEQRDRTPPLASDVVRIGSQHFKSIGAEIARTERLLKFVPTTAFVRIDADEL